jgi:hypothetical protein
MTYDHAPFAISFDDTKNAALYFDRVIPIAFRVLRGTGTGLVCEIPDEVEAEVLVQLIFGDDAPKHKIISYLDDYWSPLMRRIQPLVKRKRNSTDPDAYSEVKDLYLSDASAPDVDSVRAAFRDFSASLGAQSVSVLLPANDGSSSFSQTYSSLVLTDLPLINTASASWAQIMEIRKDPEARMRLRRLRLFCLEHYVGKPRSFIEDDLLKRLDDYERTRKKHGFDAVTSSLSILLEASTLQAAAVAGIGFALFGGPITGMSAGAAVELGKVLIELTKRRADIRNLADGHDLGYIIQARSRLDG